MSSSQKRKAPVGRTEEGSRPKKVKTKAGKAALKAAIEKLRDLPDSDDGSGPDHTGTPKMRRRKLRTPTQPGHEVYISRTVTECGGVPCARLDELESTDATTSDDVDDASCFGQERNATPPVAAAASAATEPEGRISFVEYNLDNKHNPMVHFQKHTQTAKP